MEPMNLQDINFHANWELENRSQSFKSLKQSIEHQEDKKSFVIEALLFESYLYMSDFNGNDKKDIAKAKEKNEEAFWAITDLDTTESIKDGYKSIHLALKCWFTTNQIEQEIIYKELKYLLTTYQDMEEEDKNKFQASVHATKGFALSMLLFSRYEESETELKLATEKCPENVEWRFMLGLITWRRKKLNMHKSQGSDGMKGVKEIMKNVLQLDADHAYAKTILADIHRRKYEQEVMNRTSSEQDVGHSLVFEDEDDSRVQQIMKLLTEAKQNAFGPAILSRIANCYIQMGVCRCRRVEGNKKNCSEPKDSIYFEEARKVIEYAKQNCNESSRIVFQEALLYRRMNDANNQLKCLDNVIRLDPYYARAKLSKARVLAFLEDHEAVTAVYKSILSDFKHDPFVLFDANRDYSYYLILRKQFNDAVSRKQDCLDIALQSFVKNSGNGSIEFIDEQESEVDVIIKYLKRCFEIESLQGQNKVASMLKNAELHEKICDFKKACCYYKAAFSHCACSFKSETCMP
ncbi:uncharacterized protein [Antedon mediterranea]|uniref:uncharacterized protein n=1 Tax=Antedon mediterranea TaxID=105859 RepID=UPI003AF4F679